MPDLAPAHASAPPGGTGWRPTAASTSPDLSVDADFCKHLADAAATDDVAGQTGVPTENRHPPSARWRQRGDAERLRVLDCDVQSDAQATCVIGEDRGTAAASLQAAPAQVDNCAAVVAASSTFLAAQAAAVPAITQTVAGVGMDTASATPPTIPADAAAPPRIPEAKGIGYAPSQADNAGVGTRAPAHDVTIVRRETHLAPSTPAPASLQVAGRVAAEAPSADTQVLDDAPAVASAEAKSPAPHPTVVATRGKDGGQWLAQGSLPRSPAAEPGMQVQAASGADEAFPDSPQAGRSAASGGQEAQLAPQLQSSPARQIADSIAADILAVSEQARTDPAASPPKAPSAQPLKVLTIQLHPAELGTVTIRIALKNAALELQIEAGHRDTARLIDADRDALSGLLRSAGYSIEAVTVRAVEPSGHAAASSPGSSHGSPDAALQSQSGGSQPDARPSGGRAHAERDSNPHRMLRDTDDKQDGSHHRPGDGLYV